MLRKSLAMLVAAAVLHVLSITPVFAAAKAADDSRLAMKVRGGILKLGAGKDARVELRLRNGTKLDGYISEATDTYFVLVNSETGASTDVAYDDVTKVKGHNLSTGAKIGIGVAIGIAVVLIVIGALGGLSNR
jgi:hypothetical protein